MSWFHSASVQFPRAWHHSKQRRRWVGVKGSTCNGRFDRECSSVRHLRMVQVDAGSPCEVTTCAYMASDETIGCTRASVTMWWSS
ncbi:uncharacterized protein TNCV_473021 [Trichonephila clavipes]|nr:uncharacterized protein TNCV_473021 [Trichonephila clavipes]